jgi:Flp pilus assembly secretin CpaC
MSVKVRVRSMSYSFAKFAAVVALSVVTCLALGPVQAEDGAPISVKVNMARVLRINSPASTVIIGNPGVADVTIQDPLTLVLTGKSYGQTNLIVLDDAGNPIADTLIEVIQAQADTVTIYQGQARTTLSCAPQCQQTIMVGDDVGYTSNAISSSTMVQGSAQ